MLLEKEGIKPFLENWTDKDDRLPPHYDDLEFLYSLIREKKSKVVMEFGCGYSTQVIAKALEKNREEWDGNLRPYKSDRNFWTLFIVEANWNGKWLAGTMKNLQTDIRVMPMTSIVTIGTFHDQICHYYTRLPSISPEFVYLDGPDPMSVTGQIRGFSFQHPDALPMAADLLLLEPVLLPGTTMLIDGRTSNARFLQRNFQRKWKYVEYAKDPPDWEIASYEMSHHFLKTIPRNVTVMELKEAPLR